MNHYILKIHGSISVPDLTMPVGAEDDEAAIKAAQHASEKIACANYKSFSLWPADNNAKYVAKWYIDLVPTIWGEQRK